MTHYDAEKQRVKDSRTIMRRIQEHLRHMHIAMAGQTESVGYVQVICHPELHAPNINYMMPRRGTVSVPETDIARGLAHMRELDRLPRIYFAEGLFMPRFTQILTQLNLQVENEFPMMVQQKPETITPLRLKDELRIVTVATQQDAAIWWYVWRNAFYDVITTGAEPLVIGQTMAELYFKRSINLILYRYDLPVGAVQITCHEASAYLVGFAIMKEVRTPELIQTLRQAAVQAAFEADCDMVFTTGTLADDRQALRDLGFSDAGNMIAYHEVSDQEALTTPEHAYQTVLVI